MRPLIFCVFPLLYFFPKESCISNVFLLRWGNAAFPDTPIGPTGFARLLGGNAVEVRGLGVLILDGAN